MLYVGTELGIFRRIDDGATWMAPVAPIEAAMQTSVVAFDPRNPSIAYAGTAYTGVLKSEDRGETWRVLTDVKDGPTAVTALTVDPAAPSTLYAGSYAGVNGALYRSLDGGATWRGEFIGPGDATIRSIAVDPSTQAEVYVGTDFFAFKSTHSGLWQRLGEQQYVTAQPINVMAVALDPRSPQTLYAGTAATVGFEGPPVGDGVYSSKDAGASWSALHGGMRPNTPVRALSLLPDTGILYAGTSYGVFQLSAGDQSWRAVNDGLDGSDVKALAYSRSSDCLYAATWNRLFKLVDASREAESRAPRDVRFR
ncbi:MAG TPA: hypothetical protein VGQ32_10035 [Thermoanaerobaculia bacterium]|nr:hypothetical protein [Thermoanaerobaculia bacterium]